MSTNGKQAVGAAEAAVRERKRGMALVREVELWRLASLIGDALEQGAYLAGQVYAGAGGTGR